MEWIIRNHETVLLWMCAFMLLVASPMCIGLPVLGVCMRIAAAVFVLVGACIVREGAR